MAQAGMNPLQGSFSMKIIIKSETSFSIIDAKEIGPVKSRTLYRYCKNQNM